MTGYDGRLLSRDEQDLQVVIALAFARDGDAWGMLAHLQQANVLAGIKITFRRRWPRVPDADVDDMIGRGLDALFHKAQTGAAIDNPVGYILQVMRHEAYDYLAQTTTVVPLDEERDGVPEVHAPSDGSSERRKLAALSVARGLLPRLGQDSIQTVMSLILDAVEAGNRQITTTDIAAASGLTEGNVRQCRSRGFRRLERIVRDEGLALGTRFDQHEDGGEETHEGYPGPALDARIDDYRIG